jgi:hypothetical protein
MIAATLFHTWVFFSSSFAKGEASWERLVGCFFWAIRRTHRKRIVRNGSCTRDVHAMAAKGHCAIADGLDGNWLIDARAEIPTIVASKLDYEAWTRTLSSSDREHVSILSQGGRTKDIAADNGVSPGAVAQWRRKLEISYHTFNGETL